MITSGADDSPTGLVHIEDYGLGSYRGSPLVIIPMQGTKYHLTSHNDRITGTTFTEDFAINGLQRELCKICQRKLVGTGANRDTAALSPGAAAIVGHPAEYRDPWDESEIVDFHNQLIENAPDDWDGDEAQIAIILAYVRHLEDEVQRVGGCLRRWCRWQDNEPCDHGYPRVQEPPGSGYWVGHEFPPPPQTDRGDNA